MIHAPPPTYEQTIDLVVECGIARSRIRIAYEDDLQSDEITISDLGEINEEKLNCLKAAVHPWYILTISDPTQRMAFEELSDKIDRPKIQAEAREWVKSKGLLNRVPIFDPKEGLEAFARAVETSCGFTSGNVLSVVGKSSLAVPPGFFTDKKFETAAGGLHCLIQVIAASNAWDHGIRLGFIGNAAVAPSEEE